MAASSPSSGAPRRVRVAVLYGGRSGEHEISLQSAASVLRNLDRERFEAIPIAIDKEGRWHPGDVALIDQGARTLPVFKDQPPVLLPPSPRAGGAELVPYGETALNKQSLPLLAVDVVFPVMHGTLCEDGAIQGLLELADLPYVGCGVLASAVGMDKAAMKAQFAAHGLPQAEYRALTHHQWVKAPAVETDRLLQAIEALETAMEDFPGTILAVSHDRYFLERICSRTLEIRSGILRDFPGNFAWYDDHPESGVILTSKAPIR